jgi:uncharacterized protein (TIGR02099 family)
VTFFAKFTKGLAYFLAVFLIIAATLVSIGRLMTPYLNEHRAQFETLASDLLHSPVKIHHIHISWNMYVPELTFEKVTVLDTKTEKPTFEIGFVKINLSLFKSLIQKKPVLSYIKVADFNLKIREEAKDQMNIEGFGSFSISNNVANNQKEVNPMLAWVVSQPALVLDDIHIQYIPLSKKEKSITLYKLSLRNSKNHHVLRGHATLHQDIPTSVSFAISTGKEIADFSKIDLHLYLYLEGVLLPQWLKGQTWHDLEIKQGLASAKVWADWNKGEWTKIQTQFQAYELELFSPVTKKTQFITRLSGHVGWRLSGDQQIFAGEDIYMDLPEHLWPRTHFYIKTPKDLKSLGDITLQLGFVDLHDIQEFIINSNFLSQEMEKKIVSLHPTGEINNLNVTLKDREHWLNNPFSVEFNHVSLRTWESFPGIQNFSGKVFWDGKAGEFLANTHEMQLDYPAFLTKPFHFSEILGKVSLQKNPDDSWIVQGKDFSVKAGDLATQHTFHITKPAHDPMTVDVNSDFAMSDTLHLADLITFKKLDPELNAWLKQAFQHGVITDGKLTLQGKLSDFPFRENNGKFLVNMNVDHLHFNYAPNWPALTNTKGNVTFAGASLNVNIESGQILDIPVTDIHAEIPRIGPHEPEVLTIDVPKVHGDLNQGFQLITASPLNEKLGKELSFMHITGPMDLKLLLTIPLKKPQEAKVKGEIVTDSADIQAKDWNLKIDDIVGMLNFTENALEAKNLQGKFYGAPIVINANTKNSTIKITADSQFKAALLQQWAPNVSLQQIVQGETPFNIEILVPQNAPSKITLRSNLKGVAVNLPEGFGKKANENTNFISTLELAPAQPLKSTLVFGKSFSAAMTLKDSAQGLNIFSGEIRLGGNGLASIQTAPGFLISGNFNTLDLDALQSYMPAKNNEGAKKNEDPDVLLKYLRAIDVRANTVLGFNQKLTNARLQLARAQKSWSININSNELAGQIMMPDAKTEMIQANLQYLYLTSSKQDSKESLNPKNLPPLAFTANELRFDKTSFGRVSFQIVPNSNGVNIKSLRAESPIYRLNASGEWQNNRTHLQGSLNTKDISKLIHNFLATTSSIVGSSGTSNFDLRWEDAPFRPALASMSGTATINLGAGRIINLDKSTNAKMGFGRLLNILSVESLTRSLRLNFSDLTDSGFGFDSIKGNLSLKNGNANTDNPLVVEGSLAKIEIRGRIGLATKDYNLKVKVTPHVTGSIPVVAALAVNPLVGVAAWAIEKIASGAVGSATTRHYTITGPWENPVWKEK